jgi:hypothetical protein
VTICFAAAWHGNPLQVLLLRALISRLQSGDVRSGGVF